jgi:hypothetical protein
MVPQWLRAAVRRALRPDGTMAPADLALYTRALVASPAASLNPVPAQETFEWVRPPLEGGASGTVYVDGSRIDAEGPLAGLCARHGWAVAVFDTDGNLQASAKGRPPAWSPGIHGAELWALLMASQIADPWASIKVDCLSVQQGAQRGQSWAEAPERKLARAWAPIAATMDADPHRVVWMPAHCTESHVGKRQLSNGEYLTAADLKGNALVDALAKEAARENRLPSEQRNQVRSLTELVDAVARWIGQVTKLANSLPDPTWDGSGKQKLLRDSEGMRAMPGSQRRQSCKPVCSESMRQQPGTQLSDLSSHPRWAALRQRIAAKEAACKSNASSSSSSNAFSSRGGGLCSSSSIVSLTHAHLPSSVVSRRRSTPVKRPRAQQLSRAAKRARGLAEGLEVAEALPHHGNLLQARVEDSAAAAGPSPKDESAHAAGALADLAELQRSGFSVTWPSCHSERQAKAAHATQLATEVSNQLHRQPATRRQTSAAADDTDARRDLAELELLGFRVHWA